MGGRVCGRVYGYIRTFARPSVHPCVQKNRSYFCKIDLILKNRIYFGMYVQLHGRTYTHPRTRPYTRPRTRAPVRTFVRTPVRTPVHPPVHLSACLHARRKFTRSYHTLARARKTSHPRQIHHCTTPSIFIIYIYIYAFSSQANTCSTVHGNIKQTIWCNQAFPPFVRSPAPFTTSPDTAVAERI